MRRTTLLLTLLALPALAVPSFVEPVTDGVWMVRDDAGQWGGMGGGMGITHQNHADYQARKILDLSDVPAEVWAQVRSVRLSLYFMLHDYSWHALGDKDANGLDEAYQIVVNGTVHEFPTAGHGPVYPKGGPPTMAWHDIDLPRDEVRRGVNEIIIRKAPSDKNDDYLYLGIDPTRRRGNSAVAFAGDQWTQDRLTIPGGNGEYMVRLYLVARDLALRASWLPGADLPLEDPAGLIVYAGARTGQTSPGGLRLAAEQTARVEWTPGALDALNPLTATVELDGPATAAWLDASNEALQPQTGETITLTLPARRTLAPSGLLITAAEPVTVRRITVTGSASYHPVPRPLDLAPTVTPLPPAAPAPRRVEVTAAGALLSDGSLTARFTGGAHLQLASLRHELVDREMVRVPEAVNLFLVEVGGERFAGSRDFALTRLAPQPDGFTAALRLDLPAGAGALTGELTARLGDDGLRLGLNLTNAGAEPVDFKVAFPHLAGLAVSDDPADDYYFYPLGGGIIADVPTTIRKGYGDHQALYQVMDLFSPGLGGGLAVRADDAEGWHKILSLRKVAEGQSAINDDFLQVTSRVRPEYLWTDPLADVPGTGFTYEYLRRTRPAGGSFAPADAVLSAHPGDWKVPFQAYAQWAHEQWTFRPYPSRLASVRNMIAAGWATGYLFREGAYRTDIIKPRTDCIELMSWWDWSPLGPFSTPMDQLDQVLKPDALKRWQPYLVDDPVTGQRMWNNQPGDYVGYNERFGGLPAFRKAIETYRDMGSLVTLYTDPFRLDDACAVGQAHGREWGVVGMDGELTTAYEVWNPCHDLPAVRSWVAETMGRVMRETGADGIRLDEYGHRGWACYSPTHQHTYAEPGITQWQKATAEATRMVREAMDAVRPDLVLTTEHPGYDYLMQYLEGCITYDLTVMRSPLRPLECNLQRFYFPECVAYELDHQGADRQDRKKFWNAVESFGRYYPLPFYTTLTENHGTYWSRQAEPLVPTLVPRVYANRFEGDGKTIWHLYNATGHTVDGPLLAVPVPAGHHLVDLLGTTALRVTPGAPAQVSGYLSAGEVASVALLPERLTVAGTGAQRTVTVRLDGLTGPARLVVTNPAAEVVASQDATAGATTLALPADAAGPLLLKLLVNDQLADALPLGAGAGGG